MTPPCLRPAKVSGRKELALAAINTLVAVLNSQSACDALTPTMWKRTVAVFAAGTEVAATEGQVGPAQACRAVGCLLIGSLCRGETSGIIPWQRCRHIPGRARCCALDTALTRRR